MGHIALTVPDPPPVGRIMTDAASGSAEGAEVESALRHRVARARGEVDEWLGAIRQVQAELPQLADVPPEADLDQLIETLLLRERETAAEALGRQQAWAFARAISDRGALFQASIDELSGFSMQVAEALRDLRWALMAFRAERLPSAPAGEIVGEDTDLDALLAG